MFLKGLFTINDIDPYAEYGVFLYEAKPADRKNYSALMRPSSVKPQKEVSFREQDGAKTPDRIVQRREARDVSLQFCICAVDKVEFLQRYADFVRMLQMGDNGWLDIYLPELDRHFHVYYKECSDYKQLTDFEDEVVCWFSVKFREPQPAF